MPTCLSAILQRSSKRFKLLFVILFISIYSFGQTSLTGLWIGAFSNDSTTIRKEQSFEIALTEFKGKVFGYSRSEFIVNDTLYYIVKRVKGTINGDACEVKDDEIIAFNFPTRLDKGIKVTSYFYRNKVDSTWHLAGNWKTNQTKHYYSVTGKIDLAEEKDLTASKLFPHLEELKLSNDIAFYKDRQKQQPIMREVASESKLFSSIRNEKLSTIPGNEIINGLTDEVDVNTVAVSTTNIIRSQTNTSKTSALEIPVKTQTPGIMAEVKEGPAKERSTVGISVVEADKTDLNTRPPAEIVNLNTPSVNSTKVVRTNASITKTNALEIPVKTETGEILAQVKEGPAKEKSTVKTDAQDIDLNEVDVKPAAETVKVNTPAISNTNVIRTNASITKTNAVKIPVKTEAESKTAALKPINEREKTSIKPATQPMDQSIAQNPVRKPQADIVKTTPAIVDQTQPIRTNPELKSAGNTKIPVKTENATVKTNIAVETKKQTDAQPGVSTNLPPQKSLEEIVAPAKIIGGRNSEFTQTVNFKSDSLQLSLYDNGEIDGDTVSLYINGQPLLVKQGLKASAIKKTIYLPAGTNDEFTLVLYAENLGKYPPNTGLLVVHDGEDVYNVRFSADYQKNSGVVFRRKQ